MACRVWEHFTAVLSVQPCMWQIKKILNNAGVISFVEAIFTAGCPTSNTDGGLLKSGDSAKLQRSGLLTQPLKLYHLCRTLAQRRPLLFTLRSPFIPSSPSSGPPLPLLCSVYALGWALMKTHYVGVGRNEDNLFPWLSSPSCPAMRPPLSF